MTKQKRRILITGSGGRECAIARSINPTSFENPETIFTVPGNAGASFHSICVRNFDALSVDDYTDFVTAHDIDLTIIGSESLLEAGIVDQLRHHNHAVVGPTEHAAQLEASKSFAKAFMNRHNIPTADYKLYTTKASAENYCLSDKTTYPIVIKADGLAAGKGVFVTPTQADAQAALDIIFTEKRFGNMPVVIESFLQGTEASLMAFIDNHTIVPMPYAQDYKRAYTGNKGPNTGGMGAISPAPSINPVVDQYIKDKILYPTLAGIQAEKMDYRGIIYIGLMIHPDDTASVVEYNVRYGDPEAQVILPRLKTDSVAIYDAIVNNKLNQCDIKWESFHTAFVVLAAKGYPGSYETGQVITAPPPIESRLPLLHAGTLFENGKTVTAGGRVMGVLGTGESVAAAAAAVYDFIPDNIQFDGMTYRTDIGANT